MYIVTLQKGINVKLFLSSKDGLKVFVYIFIKVFETFALDFFECYIQRYCYGMLTALS